MSYLRNKKILKSQVIAEDSFGNFIGIDGVSLNYYSEDLKLLKCLYVFECNKVLSYLVRFKIFQRLFRFRLRSSIKFDKNIVIFCYMNYLYSFDINKQYIIDKKKLISSMSSPLYMTIADKQYLGFRSVLFGDYIYNTVGKPVAINSYCPISKELKKITFIKKVCHIHNIIYSQEKNCIYIFTGDNDEESNIFTLSNDLILKKIVGGSQEYRACVGLLKMDSIIYCTDSPNDRNFLIDYNINSKNIVNKIPLPGPTIYGCVYDGCLLFSTNVEPREIKYNNLFCKLIYYISWFPSDFNSSKSFLYMYKKNNLIELGKFDKSFLPLALFGFGSIRIIILDNYVALTFLSLSKYDGCTLLIKKNEVFNE